MSEARRLMAENAALIRFIHERCMVLNEAGCPVDATEHMPGVIETRRAWSRLGNEHVRTFALSAIQELCGGPDSPESVKLLAFLIEYQRSDHDVFA